MKKVLMTLALVSLLGGGSCLMMGCMFSSMHNTEREISWGMSVKVSHETKQGPDVVAWDKFEAPSIIEAVFGSPDSGEVDETPKP